MTNPLSHVARHYLEGRRTQAGFGTEDAFDWVVDPMKMVHPYVALAE